MAEIRRLKRSLISLTQSLHQFPQLSEPTRYILFTAISNSQFDVLRDWLEEVKRSDETGQAVDIGVYLSNAINASDDFENEALLLFEVATELVVELGKASNRLSEEMDEFMVLFSDIMRYEEYADTIIEAEQADARARQG